MFRNYGFKSILAVLIAGLLLTVPAFAQETVATPGTITVTGTGEGYGAPDIATLTLGVQVIDKDIKVAFNNTNTQIETVIAAIVAAGVEEKDIRTSGLNIYQENQPMGMDGQMESRYYVSNQVLVTVRDISKAADVINVAVDAGANNLYGLEFNIDDNTSLETVAREAAFADAKVRAEALAALAGLTLGEVQSISEVSGGGFYSPMARDQMGGGGAVIQPGQLSVGIQLQVTFAIQR